MEERTIINRFIEYSNDIYIVSKSNGDIAYQSDSALKAFDVTDTSKLELGKTVIVHPDDKNASFAFHDEVVQADGSSLTKTLRYITKSGNLIKIDWTSFYDKESQLIYLRGSLTDQDAIRESNLQDEFKKMARLGSWEYDFNSGQITWDAMVYEIYELSPKTKVTLQRMEQFFREESREKFKKKFNDLLASGVFLDLELNFISGKFKPSTGRFMARLKDEGGSKKIIGTIQDLTEIRRIERKAEDYQEAVDKSSIVSITDRDGVITEVNDKFCEISKFSHEELIGNTLKCLNSGFHSDGFWKSMWETIASGEVWRGEIKNKTKDDTFFWVDTTIIPFKNSSGRIYQYLSIQRDFTENKRLNEELMVSEKLSSIGEISAQIMHEVMTPLSIISLSIENLEDNIEDLGISKEDAKSVMSNLHEIEINYSRIDEIFNNMRSVLVRQDDDSTSVINIKEAIEKTLTLVNAKLKSKKVTINYEQVDPTLQIKASQSDLFQIFLNLINNSCDAVDNLPEKWINISTSVENGNTIIKFQDSGSGIPHEIRQRIFDNLFTTKGHSKGTGLGMGVCKKLVQRHRGDISIDAKAANTTFVLSFPYSD